MQNSEVLFRDKPIWQAIFSLVGPSILSVLVMAIYNMTDLFFYQFAAGHRPDRRRFGGQPGVHAGFGRGHRAGDGRLRGGGFLVGRRR